MPIYYALVAKDQKTVLVDFTLYAGNFKNVADQLMERI